MVGLCAPHILGRDLYPLDDLKPVPITLCPGSRGPQGSWSLSPTHHRPSSLQHWWLWTMQALLPGSWETAGLGIHGEALGQSSPALPQPRATVRR
jgi:hypothetical protein